MLPSPATNSSASTSALFTRLRSIPHSISVYA
jgi:hypothetical protein